MEVREMHPGKPNPPRVGRWVLACTGILLVGIGALGAILPGLPTTIFLIGASWCFARSCPWLEERLLRIPLFRPFMAYVDGTQPLPARARAAALAGMWTCILISMSILLAGGSLSAWGAAAFLAAGAVGTVAILRFRRAAPPVTASTSARRAVDPRRGGACRSAARSRRGGA